MAVPMRSTRQWSGSQIGARSSQQPGVLVPIKQFSRASRQRTALSVFLERARKIFKLLQ
jgi:hypothetical protein